MSKTISAEAHEHLTDLFRDAVQQLLDDPAWLLDGDGPEYLGKVRRVADELGLPFDTLIAEIGTDYEIARLLRLERGEAQFEDEP